MSLLTEIEKQLNNLPPDKQNEVLDFIIFLQERTLQQRGRHPGIAPRRSLKKHPAFGLWQSRHLDAVAYQQKLRSEWEQE